MRKFCKFLPVLWIGLAMLACGSSHPSRELRIQLAPNTSTIAVGSSVVINAQTSPALPKNYGSLTWMVKGFGITCTETVADPANALPMPGCSSGWLAYAQPGQGFTPTVVYYHAATIPGSFTVMVNGVISDSSGQTIQNVGSAAAFVTVKTQ